MQIVGGPRLSAQLALDLVDGVGVEQVAQLLLPEQLPQQLAVERQRLCPPLGRRACRPRTCTSRRSRRGARPRTARPTASRPRRRRPAASRCRAAASGAPAGRRRPAGTRGRSRARSGRPDTGARPGAGTAPSAAAARAACARPGRRRGISSARAAFSRKRAPKSALWPTSCTTSSSTSSAATSSSESAGARVRLGQVQGDAVVRPDRLHLEPERLAQPRGERQRPRRVHATAERGQDADAPVADLVAEALDDDRAIGRHRAGRAPPARAGTRAGCAPPARPGGTPSRSLPSACSSESATSSRDAAPIAAPSSYGLPTPSPFQNGTAPGHARRRRDEHAVARDLLDPPGRGAEHERLPGPGLVDHLLVELAHAAAARRRAAR